MLWIKNLTKLRDSLSHNFKSVWYRTKRELILYDTPKKPCYCLLQLLLLLLLLFKPKTFLVLLKVCPHHTDMILSPRSEPFSRKTANNFHQAEKQSLPAFVGWLNRVRRQSGFPTFISCQRQDANVLPKRRQLHQGDKLCDVSTVPLVARWPVFLARGSDADGEPHYKMRELHV